MFQKVIRKFRGKNLVDHVSELLHQLPEDSQKRVCEAVLDLYVQEINALGEEKAKSDITPADIPLS